MVYESELSKRLVEIVGLTLTSVHLGIEEKTSPENEYNSGYKYLQDKWSVTIFYNEKEYTTNYSAGTVHRTLLRGIKKEGNRFYNNIYGKFKTEMEACKAQWLKLVEPNLVDVMHCLLTDGSCSVGTFEDFCDNLGYDSDSRKALETYLACQAVRNNMIRLLGLGLFEELSQLEH